MRPVDISAKGRHLRFKHLIDQTPASNKRGQAELAFGYFLI